MKRIAFLFVLSLYFLFGYAQIPENYYKNAFGLRGDSLKEAMHKIIQKHDTISYKGLWACYPYSDARPDDKTKVWDIYSDVPGGTPPYTYTFITDQCGNYSGEGNCYNKEHLVPQSWFKDASPMVSDLHHVYPTDGKVNGERGNYPFGEVRTADFTSKNGSKRGSSKTEGFSGTVFEPIDEYKGDIARVFFYMAVCYMDKNLGQYTTSIFSGSTMDQWAVNMFIRWHNQDPVSPKETDRNHAVDSLQGNRNPFIDYPELVDMIFGSKKDVYFKPDTTGGGGGDDPGDDPGEDPGDSTAIHNYVTEINFVLYPNPATDKLYIRNKSGQPIEITALSIFDLQGRLLYMDRQINNQAWAHENILPIDFSTFKPGCYFVKIDTPTGVETHKVMVR